MSTIKSKSSHVETSEGNRVEVRRMRWKSLRDFLRVLGSVAGKVLSEAKPGATIGDAVLANLPEVVIGSDELVTILLLGSTDLKLDDLDKLAAIDGLSIVAAALSVNCDDELKKSLAGIAESVAGLLPRKEPTPDASQTTTK